MKKTFLVALLATTLFACSTPAEKTASAETDATASSCVRIELFKQQRESTGVVVDAGTPNLEVVTVPTTDEQYKGIKWGHAWVNFKNTSKTGEISKSLTFISFAIKDGKILWEQVIYDAK